MANIIGLTKAGGDSRIMVNADNIVYFQPENGDGSRGITEILMVGGAYLQVREDIYTITERIEAHLDYSTEE
jgi:hypothetical protein